MKIPKTLLLVTLIFSVICGTCYYAVSAGVIKTSILLPYNTQPIEWPPQREKRYPDLVLASSKGEHIRLSDFKDKILLIEMVGMNCPACNSFNGAHQKGGFKGTVPQSDLSAIEQYFAQYIPGTSFDDPRIVHIQILLYNYTMEPVTEADAKAWAKHFGLDKKPNLYVLAGGKELVNQASYDLIPGFQLVDKHFILRADSTGHHPIEGWWSLIRKIPQLLKE